MPIYGNKVIAVHGGVFDVHGKKRVPTWTTLSETAAKAANQIKLREPVDWVIGEEIVIAPTSYNMNESETRFIK